VSLDRFPRFRHPAHLSENLYGFSHRLMLKIKPEDLPDLFGLCVIHDKAPPGRIDIVAEDWVSSRPFTLFPRRRDFVPCAFGDNFPLELGERQ